MEHLEQWNTVLYRSLETWLHNYDPIVLWKAHFWMQTDVVKSVFLTVNLEKKRLKSKSFEQGLRLKVILSLTPGHHLISHSHYLSCFKLIELIHFIF